MSHRVVVDVVVRQDYQIGFEQFDDTTFCHVLVHRWSPRVARQFRADIEDAHRLLGRPVYALERPEAPNQLHFLKLHGFVPCGRVLDAAGRDVSIYGRTIHGQPLQWFQHPEQ